MNRFLSTVLLALALAISAEAANYTLEITQPQPSLTTRNRYYKAYPGVPYVVPVGVIGGEYPYTYALTSYPSGMTIDSSTGVITWSNPVESGSPHTVSVLVTDNESSTDTVSWTITVTTSGFIFVDADAAGGGDGSISTPFDSMGDIWLDNNDDATYEDYFVYIYTGTYNASGWADLSPGGNGGYRANWYCNNKPCVWLSYPGESPVWDGESAHILFENEADVYIDGIEFHSNSTTLKCIEISSNVDNFILSNCTMDGDSMACTIGSNCSTLMVLAAGDQTGSYYYIVDNSWVDVGGTGGYGPFSYSTYKMLYERNSFANLNGHAVSTKESDQYWNFRKNTISNCPDQGIGVQYSNTGTPGNSGNMEISFNYVNMTNSSTDTAITLNSNLTTAGDPVYVHRNTFSGSVIVNKVTATNGDWYLNNNVIVNDDGGDGITEVTIDDPTSLIISNNLNGVVADNIIDASGLLLGAYRVSYLGTHGWELGPESSSTPTASGGSAGSGVTMITSQ